MTGFQEGLKRRKVPFFVQDVKVLLQGHVVNRTERTESCLRLEKHRQLEVLIRVPHKVLLSLSKVST